MAKRIITISREFGSSGRFKKWRRNLALHITTRISLDRLQSSLDYHRSIFRKMLNCLPRRACLPMIFIPNRSGEWQAIIHCL